MEYSISRPYLVLARLMEQSTWGGSYIAAFKNIQDPELQKRKIGQSYELFGKTILSRATDTSDPQFQNDLITYNRSQELPVDKEFVSLGDLISIDPKAVLGPAIRQDTMPLLLKFTQALGNSFQIHVKKNSCSSRWKAKPESWYYLEDGIITFGVKKGVDLGKYKKICLSIEAKMSELSRLIKQKRLSYKEASKAADDYIKEKDPWQFVNLHKVKKYTIVDLSAGGIHHSWEEDPVGHPQGNVLYEVQTDVDDHTSTIRCFDRGKIKPDGTVRDIHVEDYFSNLDLDPKHNSLDPLLHKKNDESLLQTPNYSLDALTITKELLVTTGHSFVHFFVVEGDLQLETTNTTLVIAQGHSCFVPHAVGSFSLSPVSDRTRVLKTYIA